MRRFLHLECSLNFVLFKFPAPWDNSFFLCPQHQPQLFCSSIWSICVTNLFLRRVVIGAWVYRYKLICRLFNQSLEYRLAVTFCLAISSNKQVIFGCVVKVPTLSSGVSGLIPGYDNFWKTLWKYVAITKSCLAENVCCLLYTSDAADE